LDCAEVGYAKFASVSLTPCRLGQYIGCVSGKNNSSRTCNLRRRGDLAQSVIESGLNGTIYGETNASDIVRNAVGQASQFGSCDMRKPGPSRGRQIHRIWLRAGKNLTVNGDAKDFTDLLLPPHEVVLTVTWKSNRWCTKRSN
jgi:hypothetical protein